MWKDFGQDGLEKRGSINVLGSKICVLRSDQTGLEHVFTITPAGSGRSICFRASSERYLSSWITALTTASRGQLLEPENIHASVAAGDLEALSQYIEACGDVNILDENGNTLLVTAALHDQTAVCKLLLQPDLQADATLLNDSFQSALTVACLHNHRVIAEMLLSCNRDSSEQMGMKRQRMMDLWNSFIIVAQHGFAELCEVLLGYLPLDRTVCCCDTEQVQIDEQSMPEHMVGITNQRVLRWAVEATDPNVFSLLLRDARNVPPSARGELLEQAVRCGAAGSNTMFCFAYMVAIAEILLRRMESSLVTARVRQLLQCAMSCGHEDVALVLLHYDSAASDAALFACAVEHNFASACKQLLRYGAQASSEILRRVSRNLQYDLCIIILQERVRQHELKYAHYHDHLDFESGVSVVRVIDPLSPVRPLEPAEQSSLQSLLLASAVRTHAIADALYIAACFGVAPVLRKLLGRGQRAVAQGASQLLDIATKYHRSRACRVIVEALLGKDASDEAVIMYAMKSKNIDLALVLLKTMRELSKQSWSADLLVEAACLGSAALCDALLTTYGIDANRYNASGQSPLFEAVRNHADICVRILLRGGARPDGSCEDGIGGLFVVANAAICRLLLCHEMMSAIGDSLPDYPRQEEFDDDRLLAFAQSRKYQHAVLTLTATGS